MVSEKIIGSGSQSTIFLAATLGNDTRQLACKTIKTKSLDRQVAENVASELGLLKQIHHPCILRAIAIDEMVDGWVHVIMPIYHGGALQDYVLRRQTLQEDQYQFIFYQLVLAVTVRAYDRFVGIEIGVDHNFRNFNSICTARELFTEPENIFVVSDIAVPRVVIGDFGLADYLEEGASLSGVVGTLAYSAPEVLTGKDYDNKVDTWSLGAMLYFLATSNHAFMSENVDHHTVEELILKGAYDTNGAKWNEVSNGAKELIARLLTVDPKERMDLSACLDTPWFCRILSLLERLYEATQSEVP
ncbi:Calcium/calmodulin-dependent protein kinase type IV [Umbelopsis nana]